jgi:nitrate/nitrite-specific signal transduction histidine kinase
VITQILAHGMTSPLREMAAAARVMARGDYRRRVRVTSRDEVGELGRAFNRMAADLA